MYGSYCGLTVVGGGKKQQRGFTKGVWRRWRKLWVRKERIQPRLGKRELKNERNERVKNERIKKRVK